MAILGNPIVLCDFSAIAGIAVVGVALIGTDAPNLCLANFEGVVNN